VILAILGSFTILLLSLYQPYANVQDGMPLEWTFFLVWAVLGVLFWRGARGIRNGVTEDERRALMLDEDPPG
jgi:hypothetical protein